MSSSCPPPALSQGEPPCEPADEAVRTSLQPRVQGAEVKDSLIVATALDHGVAIATRNRKDFEKAGVEVVDPFIVWR